MTLETSQRKEVEHFQDKSAAKIQDAIKVISEMESSLNELSSQVTEMQRRLVLHAENEAEAAKGEIIERARKESEAAIEAVKAATSKDAEVIVKKGESETEALRKRITSKISEAVDLIVKVIQTV